jgi:molecular chaperone GrpE
MNTNESSTQSQSEQTPAENSNQAENSAQNEANNSSEELLSISASEYAALKNNVTEWKERCMRSQAEFDNVRKRLRKEADEAGTRAVARFVKPILTELDNLGRAVMAANPDAFGEFAQGVTMIQTNLLTALSGAGIEQIPCEGIFDPAVHEVLAEIEKNDVPKGTIVEVHRAGFKLKDQLIRAAQVVVAKPGA